MKPVALFLIAILPACAALLDHADGAGTTPPLNCTGAHFLVIAGANYNSFATVPPTDSSGNTWLCIGDALQGTAHINICYVDSPTPAVSGAQTFSMGGTYTRVFGACFGNTPTASTYQTDMTSSGSAASQPTTVAPGSITTATGASIVITAVAYLSVATTYGLDNSFTVANFEDYVGGISQGGGIGYRIVAASTVVNPSWSFSGGSGAVADIVTSMGSFKMTASGSGGMIPRKGSGVWR